MVNIAISSALAALALWFGYGYNQQATEREVLQTKSIDQYNRAQIAAASARDVLDTRMKCIDTSSKLIDIATSAKPPEQKIRTIANLQSLGVICSKVGQPLPGDVQTLLRQINRNAPPRVAQAARTASNSIAGTNRDAAALFEINEQYERSRRKREDLARQVKALNVMWAEMIQDIPTVDTSNTQELEQGSLSR
jgi:hypothetical protein